MKVRLYKMLFFGIKINHVNIKRLSFKPRSHLAYTFSCSNCNIIYYGKINRHIKVRYGKNWIISAIMRKRVSNNIKSAVKDHYFFDDSIGSTEDFSFLSHESIKFKDLLRNSSYFPGACYYYHRFLLNYLISFQFTW